MIIDVIQGSSEWHQERDKRITATNAAVIVAGLEYRGYLPEYVATDEDGFLNKHPFQTISHIWLEKKMGVVQEISEYAEMLFEYGHEHELEIIDLLSDEYLTFFEPKVVVKDNWMLASLDGLSESLKEACEAKAPMVIKRQGVITPSHALKQAMQGKIVDYYYSQMQWQFACIDELEVIHFGVRNPLNKEIIKFEVTRNEEYIEFMVAKCKALYDHIFNETEEWIVMDGVAKEYAELNAEIAALEAKKDYLKNGLISFSQKLGLDQTHFCDLYISKSEGRKSIDYKGLVETLAPSAEDIEMFTTRSDPSWTVRVR